MELINYKEEYRKDTVPMIMNFFNEHRDMTMSSKEFYIDEKDAEDSLEYWCDTSELYLIHSDNRIIGFVRIRFGGDRAAWLEDLFVAKEFRGKGFGSKTMEIIDEQMKKKKILAMFVDVIPRNPAAIRLYRRCGFDHINMIQLRKNYDKSLDKEEKVDILGFEFIKF